MPSGGHVIMMSYGGYLEHSERVTALYYQWSQLDLMFIQEAEVWRGAKLIEFAQSGKKFPKNNNAETVSQNTLCTHVAIMWFSSELEGPVIPNLVCWWLPYILELSKN